ncbi:ATP-binding protein [Stieleria sp. JC731]|uniref:ATP-binding protein n=1 Tax=Pirellulaceae TaxID=2691357 RepID=UPI001E5A3DEC|nr:ATP-binding protein [Stieleria sp. JC731]MCC9603536.1 ATP-binding protein [Stieleria sp. JC731]
MGLLDSIIPGRVARPRRTVIYSIHGWGKSTWSSQWYRPIFLPTEDGNADIDCPSFPLFTDYNTIMQAVMELGHDQSSHGFGTAIIDSADWLEQLNWNDVCNKKGISSIADAGFNKGYDLAERQFMRFLKACNGLRDRGMHVIFTAHCDIKRFDSPEGESYDRYLPKLHKRTSALLQEWADEVLFGQYKVYTRKSEESFGRDRTVATGSGERVIKTVERPGWQAKNRLGLPEEMTADFKEYMQYLPPLPSQVA